MNPENLPVQGPVFLIEVDKIKPNPHQPRRHFDEEALRELAGSIREFGLLQPIVVTKLEKETETGTDVEYQLLAGERRWLASKMIGLDRIPAIIRSVDLDKERLEIAIIENVQRADLNPLEAARAYAKLQDEFRLTQREIAARIGKSRETVANTIRLLGLPNQMQEALSKGQLSESQARLLLSVADLAKQQALFEESLRGNVSVRDLRAKIRRIKGEDVADQSAENAAASAVDPEAVAVEKELEEYFGAPVRVERAGPNGKITITFHSPEELHGIVNKLLDKELAQTEEPPFYPSSETGA